MKIAGKKLDGPNVEVVVFPRQSGDIVIKAQAVLDESEFRELCPSPEAPIITRRDGTKFRDTDDKKYDEELSKWARRKVAWTMIKSLEATEDLEWETVSINDPETFENVNKELGEAGFTQAEQVRIMDAVNQVNGLDQSKIEEATKNFLATQGAVQNGQSSQGSEQSSTQSGEPVNE